MCSKEVRQGHRTKSVSEFFFTNRGGKSPEFAYLAHHLFEVFLFHLPVGVFSDKSVEVFLDLHKTHTAVSNDQ
jgi:hypothetical protein